MGYVLRKCYGKDRKLVCELQEDGSVIFPTSLITNDSVVNGLIDVISDLLREVGETKSLEQTIQWTRKKPTESGYYWLKYRGWCGVVRIEKEYNCALYPGNDEDISIDRIISDGGLWAGPLYPPEPE